MESKLYAIGDLHLSLSVDKPMDVFRGWENYTSLIQKNWNDLVNEQDTVVIVGDISWASMLNQSKEDFEFIHRLNGKKIILRGNHDYWFSTKTAIDRFLNQNGFDSISILFNNCYEWEDYVLCGTRGWVNENGGPDDKKVLMREAGRLRMSLEAGKKTGKKPIAFLHYPPIYASNECYEISEVLREYNITECYYGHIHGASARYAINGERDGIYYRLVACDYTQFTPIRVR